MPTSLGESEDLTFKIRSYLGWRSFTPGTQSAEKPLAAPKPLRDVAANHAPRDSASCSAAKPVPPDSASCSAAKPVAEAFTPGTQSAEEPLAAPKPLRDVDANPLHVRASITL